MLADLVALTPPLIVAGGFVAGLIWFLRHQMGGQGESSDEAGAANIPEGGVNDDLADPASSGHHPKV